MHSWANTCARFARSAYGGAPGIADDKVNPFGRVFRRDGIYRGNPEVTVDEHLAAVKRRQRRRIRASVRNATTHTDFPGPSDNSYPDRRQFPHVVESDAQSIARPKFIFGDRGEGGGIRIINNRPLVKKLLTVVKINFYLNLERNIKYNVTWSYLTINIFKNKKKTKTLRGEVITPKPLS